MQVEQVQNITHKEAFLKYLKRMDIEMLEIILNDSIIYFGASKKLFLEKLSYIFHQVKIGGEKGYLRIKQHQRNTNTYYLRSQIFSYTNKIIIDEQDGRIVEMYSQKLKKSKDDIENLSPLELFFGDDEKTDFKSSNDYLVNLQRCTKAYEELVNDKIQILTREDIAQWLKKHTLLYDEVKGDYLLFKFNDFRRLFFMLEYLAEQLQNYSEVETALKSFTDKDPAALHQWLVDYNRLAFCNVLSFESNFSDVDETNKTLKYNYHPNMYFKGDDFLTIVKFNEIYHKHYTNNQNEN